MRRAHSLLASLFIHQAALRETRRRYAAAISGFSAASLKTAHAGGSYACTSQLLSHLPKVPLEREAIHW
jgi:hypothetical protein